LDLATGELRRNGTVTSLPPQPFKILALLVSHAGELVTREEIREHVWGQETFVDFEHGLNFAIQKIRAALRNDTDSSQYIETLPRRGYRFIMPLAGSNGVPSPRANGSVVVAEGSHAAALTVAHTSAEPPPRLNGSPTMGEFAPLSVEQVKPAPAARMRFLFTKIAALTFVVVLGVVALWTYRGHETSRADISFNARDMVLISHFENRTGEPVLDGTVEFALERELSNSLFVSVAPVQRVQDTLRMMKKPLDTSVDTSLGREICLRDGGIRALINGRVAKFGKTYTVSAGILNPRSGAEIAGRSVEARSQDGILPALRELSNQLRETLGEKLPSILESNVKLEKVSTPSLRALQFYSQAMADIEADKWESGASLLEQALAEDPNFASAHILLAHCFANSDKGKLASPHFQKAFELADTTTDRERYFILGSYYQRFHLDPDRAIQAYEALVHLYPDHFFGVHNLTFLYSNSGRWRDYEEMVIRRADLRPGSMVLNFWAWLAQVRMMHFAGATHYFARAQALISTETRESDPDIVVALEFVPVWEFMRNGDLDRALAEGDRLAETSATANARPHFANGEGHLSLKLGKLKAANDWFEKEPENQGHFLDVSNVARAEGNPEAARRALLRFLALRLDLSDIDFELTAKLCADLGLLSELKKLIARGEKDGWPPKFQVQIAKGALALAEGHNAQAILHLRTAVDAVRALPLEPFTLLAEDLLATALETQGDFAGAIDALRPMELNDVWGPDLDARYHLARLYRKVGNEAEAQSIETDLLKRLKYADPDFPMLVELQKRPQTSSAAHLK